MSSNRPIDIVVSGHLCLDMLPRMENVPLEGLSKPGRLFETGALDISTGGAVANTGLALHQLGAKVRLMSMVGDDAIGRMIIDVIESRDPSLSELITVKHGEPSSYTIVLSPQRVDRIFLHCPSTNTDFGVANINFTEIERAKIFYLGYPPILPRLLKDDGAELEAIFRQAKAAGAVTALDTSLPDPNGLSGQADWHTILGRTLPHVDIFVPSIEEILFMLRRDDYEAWRGAILDHLTGDYLHNLAAELLKHGPAIVGFKLGEYGVYLRGGTKLAPLCRTLPLNVEVWANTWVYSPAFSVNVVGTTGAGDSAYAGLLTSLVKGLPIEQAARWMCAVGACNVEGPDALSGIRTWDDTVARMNAGWPSRTERISGLQ